jgi:hypothetical protein
VALITNDSRTRLVPPHEPDSWFDIRPLRTGDLEVLGAVGSEVKVTVEALASVILAWSYPEEVTLENVRLLDLDTFLWLSTESLALSGIRSAVEKKDSTIGLSPLRPQEQADSRLSSSTSGNSNGSKRRAS